MKAHHHDLGNALGAVALMLAAIGLLAVWAFQCAGRAAQRGLPRDLHLARDRIAIKAGKPASPA